MKKILLLNVFLFFSGFYLRAQINNDGCIGANFGIEADLYSDVLLFGNPGGTAAGTIDWFYTPGGTGAGIIDETQTATLTTLLQAGGNPSFLLNMSQEMSSINSSQIWIDGIWYRDQFGGTGHTDQTSFNTASKNGEDPAIWDPGPANVLGKNDIIDAGAFMIRDGVTLTDDLWFLGLINRAEPGGTAYMDFEFLVEEVEYNPATGFTSGGPQLGHTAFTFDAGGNITKVGDIIFNVSLINGGVDADIELRIWVSRAAWNALTPAPGTFTKGPNFDGAFTGSPYGYASIIPGPEACGNVNVDGETPLAPPWGTMNTKYNTWHTSYQPYSVVEVGLNMSSWGIDHASLSGFDPCAFPLRRVFIKTRSSASFTAQLKDFAGPFNWGEPTVISEIAGSSILSCLETTTDLIADPLRTDVIYSWSTIDGNITTDPTLGTITVDQPGTYTLSTILPTSCSVEDASVTVGYDPTRPFFNTPLTIPQTSCNGNDGGVNLTPSGATTPFTFLWSNGAITEDISGLVPGTYVVTITDTYGCTITASSTVDAKTPLNITLVQTPVVCFGNSTGSIAATITGESPFTYAWSNGQMIEDVFGLAAGSYTLTVTDNDGCTETKTISVTQPPQILLSLVPTNESDPTLNDGAINLTVTNGVPTITYDWSNDGPDSPDDDTEDLTGLSRGSYTVTVTDGNGCTRTASTYIYEPEVCNDGIDNDGDGLTDCYDTECVPANPGTISFTSDPVCVGDIGVVYSIVDVGAPSYTWTVPAGATITSGQGTISITVNWTSYVGGQMCVRANNVGCLSSNSSCFTVTLEDNPAKPGEIDLNNQ